MTRVFDPDVAREVVEALSRVEAREAGRGFIWTVSTLSNAPDIGSRDHVGLLRTYDDDAITIATDPGGADGDRVIGWHEITDIGVAPDPDYA